MVASFSHRLTHFLKGEDGPTASEYAVMLGLLVLVCVIGYATIGRQANGSFNQVADQLGDSVSSYLGFSNADGAPAGAASKNAAGGSRQVANDPSEQPPTTEPPTNLAVNGTP
jgi:pilus assembly protein Flp/PilA